MKGFIILKRFKVKRPEKEKSCFFGLRFLPSHVRIKVIYTTDGIVGATEGGTDHREYKQQEPTVWAFVRSKWVLFLL